MEVTLRQLRAFIALADCGSFTRAAETLHVTQSALSGLIKELEGQLGLRLVDRSTRQSQLSDVGRDFYATVVGVLRELDRALDRMDDLKQLRSGTVRLAAPQLMASTLIPAVVAEFSRTHPQVAVRLVDCAVEDVIASVARNEVDFGVGPQRSTAAAVSATPLMAPPFVVVFPEGHPLQARTRVRWRELVRYPLITLKGQFADQLERDLFDVVGAGVIKPRHEVTFMSTALGLVHAGMGVTVCLPYAQPLVDLYALQVRPLVEPELRRDFYVYTRRYANLPPAAQAFMATLRASTLAFGGSGERRGAQPRA